MGRRDVHDVGSPIADAGDVLDDASEVLLGSVEHPTDRRPGHAVPELPDIVADLLEARRCARRPVVGLLGGRPVPLVREADVVRLEVDDPERVVARSLVRLALRTADQRRR